MESIALYRKYRPQRFEDVLGQEHVTQTLQAAIKEERIGHAYLFSGSRGTGKTTTARILAKAMNCEQGPTPAPCNTCDSCTAITAGSSLDVIEIDAASHGGVDDVRELRDNAILSPAASRKKVYIVDEAHMVSTAGWNAFLKTVEEPPSHVVFVFATTEPHKVLATILSRCQRFDFRRVSSSAIAEHLAKIAKDESIEAEDGALQLIARAAEGGVRDAMSTLDQLASTGTVTTADAARLLGTVGSEAAFEMTDAIASADTGAAVGLVARLVEDGHDLRVFTRSLIEHTRALLITKQVDDPSGLIDATDETRARYAGQADAMGAAKLTHLVRLFAEALAAMRDQMPPRLALELAVVRATMPEVDDTATAAIARIERLERVLEVGGAEPAARAEPAPAEPAPAEPAPAEPARAEPARAEPARAEPAPAEPAARAEPASEAPAQKKKTTARKTSTKKAEPPTPEPPTPESAAPTAAGSLDLDKIRRSWPVVLEGIRKGSRSLHALLAEASVGAYEDGVLTLEARFPYHAKQIADAKFARVIAEAMKSALGVSPKIRAIVRERPVQEPVQDVAGSADPADIVKAGFGEDVEEA